MDGGCTPKLGSFMSVRLWEFVPKCLHIAFNGLPLVLGGAECGYHTFLMS